MFFHSHATNRVAGQAADILEAPVFQPEHAVGHLDGWGRGKFDGSAALYYLRSRGPTGARTLSWTVRGRGVASVRIGSCRTGSTSERIPVEAT